MNLKTPNGAIGTEMAQLADYLGQIRNFLGLPTPANCAKQLNTHVFLKK